jgi:NADPH:quinone reductase-like Zn-dependent oxidoreductase
MKAVVITEYGDPSLLQFKEVEKPTPKDNEVLVKVHAASINSWDWEILQGIPFVNRMTFGLRRPKRIQSLGCDIAGVVEAVGSKVKQLQPGDEVFGDLSRCGWNGYAEYVAAPEKALTIKPPTLSFEEAAAVPQAGLLALQAICHKGQLQPGQKVLINGASGGSGTFAVQIAKAIGAEATGVCSTSKMDLVRAVGADHVIDYTQEDFTRNGQQYDLIIDMQAHHSLFDYKRALSPGGVYIMVGGESFRIFQAMFISLTGSRKIKLLLHRANKGLEEMINLLESGKVKPIIDRVYPLRETAEAFRYFGEHKARGKVVITIGENA